jgi:two-component system NarL family sensor kinase
LKTRKPYWFLLMLLPVMAKAQPPALKDSLQKALSLSREDTARVDLLNELGMQVENNSPEEAKYYYHQAGMLSEKLGYKMGRLKYYSNYTAALNMQARYDSGLLLNQQALALAEKYAMPDRVAVAQHNIAASYTYIEDYENALSWHLKSLPYFEGIKDEGRLSIIYDNIGIVYRELKLYEKALEFHGKALSIARKNKSDFDIAIVLSNMGIAYTSAKQYTEGLTVLRESLATGRKLQDDYILKNVLLNIGNIYIKRGEYDSLPGCSTEGLEVARRVGDSLSMTSNLYALGLYHFYQKDFARSMELAEEGYRIASHNRYLEQWQLHADLLSELWLAKGDFKKYDEYNRKSVDLSEQFFNKDMQEHAQLLDKKYETANKEQRLKLQQATIRQQQTWNIILGGSAVALLLIGLLAYRNYSQKRKLQQQQIAELEKEKLLLATQSILKGQEEERSRMAKDLHDGLGGMLSGVKLQLGAMKGNLILSEEHARVFNSALGKLDESISEMRRVAHNMMPEALMKLGLQQALQDYCDGLSEGQVFKINSEFHGLEQRIEPTTEVVVYRIVQELLNNAVKHSGATVILAQVMRQDDHLTITVEDNGKGFDKEAVLQGAGLKNIRSRVEYLKGHADIQSVPGKGTSIYIDCIIEQHG